jgi:hypothetical protein
MTAANKVSELERKTDDFLIEAAKHAQELVVLRNRLAEAQRERAQLLEAREEALLQGRDTLPRVRELFLEIEELPILITQREQATRWVIEEGVARVNAENRELSAQVYMRGRDVLREGLEQFRLVLVHVEESMQRGAASGEASLGPINVKVSEIEKMLNVGTLPRVTFQPRVLPPIDADAVRRGELRSAVDRWIKGLC